MIISAYSPATCKGCQDFLDSSSNSGKRDSDVWCHRSGEWSCLLPWAWIMDGRAEYSDSLSFSEWVQAEELERERELQLFSKLNLPYGSPAGWQRSQVSSSDKEEAKIISPKPNYFQKLNLSSHC